MHGLVIQTGELGYSEAAIKICLNFVNRDEHFVSFSVVTSSEIYSLQDALLWRSVPSCLGFPLLIVL